MTKTKTKAETPKKYVFIDTSVFLDVLYSDTSSEDLSKILKELNDNKFLLILPSVTFKEIEKDFKFWKRNLVKGIEQQLSIDLILNVTDKDKTGGKDVKKKKIHNSVLIDKITKAERSRLIEAVENFYETLEKNLEFIFKHKNTKVIDLTSDIILKGIERSLLKKAPSTKLDKKTEHQHLKDVDCIAFESILAFLGSSSVRKDDIFYLVTDDNDYKSDDGKLLRDELINDLFMFKKTNIRYAQSIDSVVAGKIKKRVDKKEAIGSLSGEDEGLVESSEKQQINSSI